jgi:hypothetical protein
MGEPKPFWRKVGVYLVFFSMLHPTCQAHTSRLAPQIRATCAPWYPSHVHKVAWATKKRHQVWPHESKRPPRGFQTRHFLHHTLAPTSTPIPRGLLPKFGPRVHRGTLHTYTRWLGQPRSATKCGPTKVSAHLVVFRQGTTPPHTLVSSP